jgi:hypothetical protein
MPYVGWVGATGLAFKIMIFRVGWVGAIGFAIKVMIFDSNLIENAHSYQPTIICESFGGLDIKFWK